MAYDPDAFKSKGGKRRALFGEGESDGYTKTCSQCGERFAAEDGRRQTCAKCRVRRAGAGWTGFRLYQAEHLPLLQALAVALDEAQDGLENMPLSTAEVNVLLSLRERLRLWLLKRTQNT